MDVEVTHDDNRYGMAGVLGKFGLETPNGVDLTQVRRSVPEAEQYRTTVRVDDVPAAFVDSRIGKVDDGLLESIFGKQSDASTVTSLSVAAVQLGDKVVASKLRRSSFEPSLCDANYLWVSDGLDERIDLRLVLSQSSRVKVEKFESGIYRHFCRIAINTTVLRSGRSIRGETSWFVTTSTRTIPPRNSTRASSAINGTTGATTRK